MRDCNEIENSQLCKPATNKIMTTTSPTTSATSAWNRFYHRFGLHETIVLAVSTVGIVLTTVLLLSFWIYCNYVQQMAFEYNLWARIIFGNFTTRFITIITAVLRICITIQVLFICLMLASLAIEHNQVAGPNVGWMSIYQYSSAGPFEIVIPLFIGVKSGRNPTVFITVVLLAAGSLLSQFSSTLLVSDLKPFELRAWQDSVREINYTFSDSLFQSIIQEPGSMLSSRLNEDPVFAEHATDRVVINNKTAGGLKDSGNVTRAFFPMPKAERMNIASYRGPARALFTNSICFSPRFVEATAVLTDENGNASENANTTRLVMFSGQLANITGDDLLARSSWRYGGEEISFPKIENCTLGINGMGICVVEDSERLNTLLNASKIASADLYTWILVAIPTRPVADGANLSDTQRLDRKPQRLVNQSYDGTEWLSQHYESIPVLGQQPGLGLRVKHSLCGIYADWGTSDISVDRRYNFIEPEPQRKPLQWQDSERDNITLRFFKIGYDPSSIQKQFGVDGLIKKPARDRGILSLSSSNRRTLQDRWFVRQTIYRRFEKPTGTRLSIGGLGASSPNQQLEWDHENSFFDPWVETIFINAFRDTGTLSLAWESAVTYVFGSHYASYLGISDVAGNVTVSFFETHEIPRQFRGIGVVLGVITLHLGLLMAVLGVFLRSESFKVGLEDPMRYLGVQSQRGEKTD